MYEEDVDARLFRGEDFRIDSPLGKKENVLLEAELKDAIKNVDADSFEKISREWGGTRGAYGLTLAMAAELFGQAQAERAGATRMRLAGDALPAIVNAANNLRALGAQVAASTVITPRQNGINAGRLVENVLALQNADLIVSQIANNNERWLLARGLSNTPGGPQASLVHSALEQYGRDNGLIAHYRHGASDPNNLSGHGMLVYQPGSDERYRVEHNSIDREEIANGFEGVPRAQVEYWSPSVLESNLAFREDNGWYSNFVDPVAASVTGVRALPYQGRQEHVSWARRVGRG